MSARTVSSDFLKLMTSDQQAAIKDKEQKRSVSLQQHQDFVAKHAAQTDDKTISDFINSRAALLETEIDYYRQCLFGLSETSASDHDIVQEERTRILFALEPAVLEQQALKRSKRGLSADIQEQLIIPKKRKEVQFQQDTLIEDILPRAYAKIMSSYNITVSPAEKKDDFNRKKYRKEVLEYYNAVEQHKGREDTVYCHILGARMSGLVKAAHIVPRAFTHETAEHLFGSNEQPTRSSPSNSLLLTKNIEEAFNKGYIAIVPIPTDEGTPTRWKCILLYPDLRRKTLMYSAQNKSDLVYGDIEDKELQFRSDNRPARRFLYFRFIMSIMHAQTRGRPEVIHDLQLESQLTTFWPSPGAYLCRSTLTALTRSVSGFQLPERFVNATTFEESDDQRSIYHDLSDPKSFVEMHKALASTQSTINADDSDQ